MIVDSAAVKKYLDIMAKSCNAVDAVSEKFCIKTSIIV